MYDVSDVIPHIFRLCLTAFDSIGHIETPELTAARLAVRFLLQSMYPTRNSPLPLPECSNGNTPVTAVAQNDSRIRLPVEILEIIFRHVRRYEALRYKRDGLQKSDQSAKLRRLNRTSLELMRRLTREVPFSTLHYATLPTFLDMVLTSKSSDRIETLTIDTQRVFESPSAWGRNDEPEVSRPRFKVFFTSCLMHLISKIASMSNLDIDLSDLYDYDDFALIDPILASTIPGIKTLSLAFGNVTLRSLSGFANSNSIESLRFNKMHVEVKSDAYHPMRTVKSLSLRGTLMRKSHLFFSNFPNLTTLQLNCPHYNGPVLKNLATLSPKLEILDISAAIDVREFLGSISPLPLRQLYLGKGFKGKLADLNALSKTTLAMALEFLGLFWDQECEWASECFQFDLEFPRLEKLDMQYVFMDEPALPLPIHVVPILQCLQIQLAEDDYNQLPLPKHFASDCFEAWVNLTHIVYYIYVKDCPEKSICKVFQRHLNLKFTLMGRVDLKESLNKFLY